jgi:hypothetical protein
VKPACDFAYDVLKTTDPREVLGLLDGRDRLLDGSYQDDSLAIINIAKRSKATRPKADVDQFN